MNTHLIDGQWCDGEGDAFESLNPFNQQVLWLGRSASAAQVDEAVRAARAAFAGWALRPLVERIAVVERFAECLCGQAEVLAPYAERYLAVADDISAARGDWPQRGSQASQNVLEMLYPRVVADADFVARAQEWMGERELTDSVARILTEQLDDTRRALRCQEFNAAASDAGRD